MRLNNGRERLGFTGTGTTADAEVWSTFLGILENDRAALLKELAFIEDVLIRHNRLKERTKKPTHLRGR